MSVASMPATPSATALSALNTSSSIPSDYSFNISFNLSLGSLLTALPSRIVHKLRRLEQINTEQTIRLQEELSRARVERQVAAGADPGTYMHPPGHPWAFLASGYVISLFIMALLVNRIQHIVVPSQNRPSLHRPRHSSRINFRNPMSILRSLRSLIFPVDLSSKLSRFVFRIPTLLLLGRSIFLWSIILLQTSGWFPSDSQWEWVQALDDWGAQREMQHICWDTFCAVCATLGVSSLTRGLEGLGADGNSPFNLLGYAFLLHLYSSPLTHTIKLEDLPSRPDMHVIITILLPLLQLTTIHALGISPRLSSHRLVPTTVFTLLTLLHFNTVIFFTSSNYPLINYTSCVFESMLLGVTVMAFGLNAITQLLLEGEVRRWGLFGRRDVMGDGGGRYWEEDFGVVLLRLGKVCVEITAMEGLGNEVGTVNLSSSKPRPRSRYSALAAPPATEYGEVSLSRAGATLVSHTRLTARTQEGQVRVRSRKDGFENEVRAVRAGRKSNSRVGSGADGVTTRFWIYWGLRREFGRLGREWVGAFGRIAKKVWARVMGAAFGDGNPRRYTHARGEDVQDIAPVLVEGSDEEEGLEDEYYGRFLAGEMLSDDEDEEYVPRGSVPPDFSSSEDEEGPAEPGSETAGLYADLSTSTGITPHLLAHVTSEGGSPLTRRRYQSVVFPPTTDIVSAARESTADVEDRNWNEFVAHMRAAAGPPRDDSDDERRRYCVICTVEERQIICWPCRCLALCNDCRENLASRFAPSEHSCPCCRQPVEGFSRIYIP